MKVLARIRFLLVEVGLFFLFHAVAAEEVGKVLREGCARHDRVATRFDSLGLQVSLEVRQEADDGCAALELGLQLGDQRQGLGVGVVEIEDDQAWTVLFFAADERGDGLLFVLDEGDLDPEFAGCLLNLGDEEEIFDEEEDLGWRVLGDGNGAALGVVDGLGVALVACCAPCPLLRLW